MDKKLIIILVCGLIIFVVYLYLDKNTIQDEKKQELQFIDVESFNHKNNIAFDPYTFYTKNNKLKESNNKMKYTKENFDFDYESDFKYQDSIKNKGPKKQIEHFEHFENEEHYEDRNLDAQSVPTLSQLKKTATYLKSEPVNKLEESPNWTTHHINNSDDFLVPNNLESNSIFSIL
jgi:hypothetical protein